MHIGTYVSRQKQPEMQRRCTAIRSAREGACYGRPSRRCTAQDFEALTCTSFWPQQE